MVSRQGFYIPFQISRLSFSQTILAHETGFRFNFFKFRPGGDGRGILHRGILLGWVCLHTDMGQFQFMRYSRKILSLLFCTFLKLLKIHRWYWKPLTSRHLAKSVIYKDQENYRNYILNAPETYVFSVAL